MMCCDMVNRLRKMLVVLSLALLIFSILTNNAEASNIEEVSSADLQTYMEDVVAGYKVSLKKSALTNNLKRRRRSVSVEDFQNTNSSTVYETQISEIIPWGTVPSEHPVEIKPFQVDEQQYLAVVNYKNSDDQFATKSAIYKLNTSSGFFDEVQDFATSGAVDFEYVDTGLEKYAIFLDSFGNHLGRDTHQRWFTLQQYIPELNPQKPFHDRGRVRALGGRSVKVFMKEGYYFFVTANSFYQNGNGYQVKSTLHMKVPYGFEVVQEFETLGAQDVEVATIDGVRYLFFVNHINNQQVVDIYSYVYREKENHERTSADNYAPFGLYQRIPTHGGRDFEFFTYQDNNFLVAVNEYTQYAVYDSWGRINMEKNYEIDSVIYWWTGKIWVEWQKIPTHGALKATYFLSDFGDPMLVIANSKAQATIYTYDVINGIFKPTAVQGLSPFPGNSSYIPDVRSVFAFKAFNSTFLTVANYKLDTKTGYNTFKLKFHRNASSSGVQTIPDIVKDLLKNMKEELNQVKSHLQALLLDVTNGVLTKSTTQTLTNLRINYPTKINNLTTANMVYTESVTPNLVKELAQQVVLIRNKILEHEDKIVEIERQLKDAVSLDEPSIVTGKKIFKGSDNLIFKSDVEIKTANISGLVDHVNISLFDSSALKKNSDQTVTGRYFFQEETTFSSHVNISNSLNNISVSDVLTVNTDQNISAEKTFVDDVKFGGNNVDLKDFTLNSIDVSQLLTKTGHQTITGHKHYKFVQFTSLDVNGLIQSVNVSNFVQNKVSLAGDDVINSHVTFTEGFKVKTDVNVAGYVDGVNLTAIDASLSNNGDEVEFTGSKTFQNVLVNGACEATIINGNNMANLARTNHVNTFTENVTFLSGVTVEEDVITSSKINGLKFAEDLVLTTGNHSVGGVKIFKDIELEENLSVKKQVNSFDLLQWNEDVVLKNSGRNVTGSKVFHSGVNVANLEARSLNGIPLENLTQNLLILRENTTIDVPVQFESMMTNSDLKVDGLVNGFSIPNDFVLANKTDQKVHGKKRFVSSNNTITEVTSADMVNSEDFSKFLSDVVLNSGDEDQSIHSNLSFVNNVRSTDTITADVLNDIPVTHLATLHTDQNITGEITLTTNTTFQTSISTDTVVVNGTINEIDLSVLEEEAVYKDRNQTINGNIIFVAGIECKQNLSVAGLINGVNLTELYTTTVRISKPQTVTGAKTFMSAVTFEDTLETKGTINLVNITKLNAESLKLSGQQIINGNVTLMSNVMVNKSLNANSTMNGIDLNTFLTTEAAVETNGTVIVNGNIITHNLTANHILTDKVDGISITNVIIQGKNQTLTGEISFVNISGYKIDSYSVNNLNISDVSRRGFKVDGNQNITAIYQFQNLTSVNHLRVDKLNGVDVDELSEQAISKDSDSIIDGEVVFNEHVSIENLIISNLLNEINISRLLSDSLSRYGNQTVCYTKEYVNGLAMGNATFDAITNNTFINGVNVSHVDRFGVRLSSHQYLNGSYYFHKLVTSNVYLSSLNGLDLQKEFMLTKSNQTVHSSATFSSPVSLSGNLNFNGYIDGVNITELNQRRIGYAENVSISGSKHFHNVTALKIELMENATINEILPREIVTINNESIKVSGIKTFKNVEVNELHVQNGVVNGVNITWFDQQSAKKSQNVYNLVGQQTFTKNMTIIGNLTVQKLLNNQLVDKKNYSAGVSDTIRDALFGLRDKTNLLCSKISMLMALSVTGAYLDGIDSASTVGFPTASLGALDSTVIQGVHYVSIARAEHGGCGWSYILECVAFPYCSILQSIKTNSPTLEFFEYQGQPAVLIDHSESVENTTADCQSEAEIYIWSTVAHLFVPYQTVNEDLIQTEEAPITGSKGLLKRSMNAMAKKENSPRHLFQNINTDKSVLRGVNQFSVDNDKFVVGSYERGQSNFVDLFHQSNNSSSTVGSLKRKQRIILNNQRRNYVSVGVLGKQPVLSVSSKHANDMKLYRMNPKSKKFEFYQQLSETASSVKFERIKKSEYVIFANPESGFGLCPWLGVSGFQDCHSVSRTDNRYVETITTEDGPYVMLGKTDKLVIYKVVLRGDGTALGEEVC